MVLSYINWNIDPEIFQLWGFPLRYYGLLFGAGLLLCALLLKGIYKRENLSNLSYDNLFIYGFIGIFAGARLGHCLFYDFAYYSQHPLEIILPLQQDAQGHYRFTGYQGLASHGGAIGLITALLLYAKKYAIRFLHVLDMIGVVAPLGCAFIRLANLMNSEMIGHTTDKPWAFIFRKIDDIPRHPAQLYEAIAYLLIFCLVFSVYKNNYRKIGHGFYFGVSIFCMCVMRFLIEFVKEDQADFEQGMLLNMGQILSLPFIAIGLFFAIRGWSKSQNLINNSAPDIR